MATKVVMPKLGMAMTDGVVVKWLKADGDRVEKGEHIAVVMSKKITYEVEAPAPGLMRYAAHLKEPKPVGETLAFIAEPGEAVPGLAELTPVVAAKAVAPSPPEARPPEAAPFVPATPAARRLAKERGIDISQVKGTGPEGRIVEEDVTRFIQERERAPREVLISPMARRLAQEHGLDITQITGSGPGGRIVEEDVRKLIEAEKEVPPVTAAPGRVIPFIGMRQAIAERMAESLRTMAQVTVTTEADVTETVRLREELKEEFDLTYTDIVVKAVAMALKKHPLLNATLVGEEIHLLEEVNIGVAVALEGGLIVPVVREADKKGLLEIARETKRLAQGARENTLTVDEVTGGTFTVTNVGMYEMDTFTPIINPPEAAILGVGRIMEKPAVKKGQIVVCSMMHLSLTFDHRIVDGAPAADFLRTVKHTLEKPYRLLG